MTIDSEVIAQRLHQMVEPDEMRAAQTRGDMQYRQPSSWFYTGTPSTAGVTVTESTALSLSAVFACVRNIAEDEAKLPFITYQKLEPRGKKRLPGHPLYRLLHDDPNPEMSAFDFRQAVTACAVLWGGGYAEIERTNSGVPLNLWPIESWRVNVRRDRAGELFYEVDGGKARLSPQDVFHIKGFGTDGVLGMMLAHTGRESLGLTIAAQRFAASFFGNGTRVSGILKHPKTLTPQAHTNLRESMDEKHQGPGKAHKMMILEEGADWVQTSTPPNDAQMLETRQFQVEDVARWFRMPPHKIQHLLRSTFSNIEHQSLEYVIDTLMPWLVRWEQESKRKLVSPDESEVFCEHLVDGLLRGDIKSRYDAYAVARQNGWMSANDILDRENMNPIDPKDGGDAYLVNGTMIPITRALATPEPTAVPPEPAPVAEMRSVITEANRPALLDAASRAVRREVEVIRRKAKNPTTLKDSIDTFYAGHGDYMRNSLRAAVTTFVRTLQTVSQTPAVNIEEDLQRAVTEHIDSAKTEWAEVLGDESRIEPTLLEWESRQAQAIVQRIIVETAKRTDHA
jgi:HK97 family phage portal protein